tara:strand:+ start:1145 stop:1282 length:138 start_codon:yes stop_codon:yes gene_type:complete
MSDLFDEKMMAMGCLFSVLPWVLLISAILGAWWKWGGLKEWICGC